MANGTVAEKIKKLAIQNGPGLFRIPKDIGAPEYAGRLAYSRVNTEKLPEGYLQQETDMLTGRQGTTLDPIKLKSYDQWTNEMDEAFAKHKDPSAPPQRDAMLPNDIVLYDREQSKKIARGFQKFNKALKKRGREPQTAARPKGPDLQQAAKRSEKEKLRNEILPEEILDVQQKTEGLQIAQEIRQLKQKKEKQEEVPEKIKQAFVDTPIEAAKSVATGGASIWSEKFLDMDEENLSKEEKEGVLTNSLEILDTSQIILEAPIRIGGALISHTVEEVSGEDVPTRKFKRDLMRSEGISASVLESYPSDETAPEKIWSRTVLELATSIKRRSTGEGEGLMGESSFYGRGLRFLENNNELADKIMDFTSVAPRAVSTILPAFEGALDAGANLYDTVMGTNYADQINPSETLEEIWTGPSSDKWAMGLLLMGDGAEIFGAMNKPISKAGHIRALSKTLDELDSSAIKNMSRVELEDHIRTNIKSTVQRAKDAKGLSIFDRKVSLFSDGKKGLADRTYDEEIDQLVRMINSKISGQRARTKTASDVATAEEITGLRSPEVKGTPFRPGKQTGGEFDPSRWTEEEIAEAIKASRDDLDRTSNMLENIGTRMDSDEMEGRPLREWLQNEAGIPEEDMEGAVKLMKDFRDNLQSPPEQNIGELLRLIRAKKNPESFPTPVQDAISNLIDAGKKVNEKIARKMVRNLKDIEDVLPNRLKSKLKALEERPEVGKELKQEEAAKEFLSKRDEGISPMTDREFDGYRTSSFELDSFRPDKINASDFSSQDAAKAQFWNDLSKKARGESLTSDSFDELLFKFSMDDTFPAGTSRQLYDEMSESVSSGARAMMRGDFTEGKQPLNDIGDEVVEKVFPQLSGTDVEFKIKQWVKNQMRLADQRFKTPEAKNTGPEKPLDIKEGVVRSPEPNILSDRLKPLLDVRESLKEGSLPVDVDDVPTKDEVIRKAGDVFEKHSERLGESIVPDDAVVSEIAKGTAWNATQSIKAANDFEESVQSVIRNMVKEDPKEVNLARGFPEATRSAVAVSLGEGKGLEDVERVAIEAARAAPKDSDEWLSFWRNQKWIGNISSVQDADMFMRKFVKKEVSGEPIRPPEEAPRIAEYVADQNKEGRPILYSDTAVEDQIDQFMENSKSLEFGIRKSDDIKFSGEVMRQNLGHPSHEEIGILSEAKHHLSKGSKTNTESVAILESLKDHPDLQDVVREIDDDLTRSVFGNAIKEGRIEWVREIKNSRFFDEEAGKLDMDEVASARRGPAANLPPPEAKTYFTMLNMGVNRHKALELAKKGFNKRLSDELPERLDDIQRVAFLKKAKQEFPTREDVIDEAIEKIEGRNFEQYKSLEEERLEAKDALHKDFETMDDLFEGLAGELPEGIKKQLRIVTREDTSEELYRNWIVEQTRNVENLTMGGVKQYALDIHGKKFTELNGREYADVIDFVRSAGREDYMPSRMNIPTRSELRTREGMEEDIFDPSTWKNRTKENPDGPDVGGRPEGSGGDGEVPDDRRSFSPDEGSEKNLTNWQGFWSSVFDSVKTALPRVAGDIGRRIANLILTQKDLSKRLHSKFDKMFDDQINFLKSKGLWNDRVKEKLWKALDAPEEYEVIKEDGKVVGKELVKTQDEVHKEAIQEGRALMEELGEEPELWEDIVQGWRDAFDVPGESLEESGIRVQRFNEETGEFELSTFKKRKHFFPRSFHPDLWENTTATEKVRKAFERFGGEGKSDSMKELMINSVTESADVSKAGSIDNARNFPKASSEMPYLKDVEDAARLYAGQAARRISEAQVYGPDLEELEALIKETRNSHGDAIGDWVRETIDFSLRGHRTANPTMSGWTKTLTKTVRSIEAGSKLLFAAIPNMAQWVVGTALASDAPLKTLIKGTGDVIFNREVPGPGFEGMGIRDVVSRGGYDAHHLTRQMLKRMQGNSGFLDALTDFDILGAAKAAPQAVVDTQLAAFNFTEKFTRYMGSAMGLTNFDILRNRLSELMRKVPEDQWTENGRIKNIMDRMEKFGIEHGQTIGRHGDFDEHTFDVFRIAREGPKELEKSIIMNRFNRLTNFTADEIDLPWIWNTDLGKLPFTFMNFAFNFAKLLKDSTLGKMFGDYQAGTRSTIGEGFLDNLKATVTNLSAWGLMGLPLGAMSHNARAIAAGRESEVYNNGLLTYMGAVGGMGFFSSIINDVAWGNSAGDILGGVPASDLNELTIEPFQQGENYSDALSRLATNWSEFSTRLLIPYGVGQLTSERFFSSDDGPINTLDSMMKQATNWDEILNVPTSNIPGIETDIGDPREREFAPKNLPARMQDLLARLINSGINQTLGTEYTTVLQRLRKKEQSEENINQKVRDLILRDAAQKDQRESKQDQGEPAEAPKRFPLFQESK